MATPLRKDNEQFEDRFENQEITTADLAQGKRPASEARGPQALRTIGKWGALQGPARQLRPIQRDRAK